MHIDKANWISVECTLGGRQYAPVSTLNAATSLLAKDQSSEASLQELMALGLHETVPLRSGIARNENNTHQRHVRVLAAGKKCFHQLSLYSSLNDEVLLPTPRGTCSFVRHWQAIRSRLHGKQYALLHRTIDVGR